VTPVRTRTVARTLALTGAAVALGIVVSGGRGKDLDEGAAWATSTKDHAIGSSAVTEPARPNRRLPAWWPLPGIPVPPGARCGRLHRLAGRPGLGFCVLAYEVVLGRALIGPEGDLLAEQPSAVLLAFLAVAQGSGAGRVASHPRRARGDRRASRLRWRALRRRRGTSWQGRGRRVRSSPIDSDA
jgi:hypothetical protein